jgi:hypothetical protein
MRTNCLNTISPDLNLTYIHVTHIFKKSIFYSGTKVAIKRIPTTERIDFTESYYIDVSVFVSQSISLLGKSKT